jgi:iron complex outermembrane receptor protein
MKKFVSRTRLSMAIAMVVTGVSTPSITMADGVALEEVVVTAQKREQNLQDVPVSVTAFSDTQLAEAGIETIADLEHVTPNTTLRPSRATNTTLTSYIRGIGQNDPLWGFEPGVGLYIDDIYIARPQGSMIDVYDIDRIEVLRGPQGSLYGKNTVGGAIKYVTKRLTGEAQGDVKIGLGNYNQRDITVSGQMPLIEDVLNMGVTVASFTRDGYGENLFNGDENYNKDLQAARVSFEWTPQDDVFVRLAADWSEDTSNARHGTRLVNSTITSDGPLDPFDSNSGRTDDQRVQTSGAALTVEWDISDEFTFKSITAYREGDTTGPIDFDATPVNSFDAPVWYADHQTTQEFQLSYTGDRLSVVGGLYYYDGFAAGAFDVVAGAYTPAFAIDPNEAVVPGQEADNFTFVAATQGSATTESKAAYFHANYDLTDELSLTLGARYTKDKKEADVFKAKYFTDGVSAEFGGQNDTLLVVQSDFSDGDEWSKFTPKAGIDWQLTDDVMVYYSYGEGFKSGGVNMRADVAATTPGFSQVFDPEEAKTHEVGLKGEFYDGRVRANVALFSTDYESVQQTVTRLVGANFVPTVVTDNEQEIQGLELEVMAQLTENLSLNFNYGYLDAEWSSFAGYDAVTGDRYEAKDEVVVSNTPENSAMLGLNYDMDLDAAGSLALGLTVSYTDEVASEISKAHFPYIHEDD